MAVNAAENATGITLTFIDLPTTTSYFTYQVTDVAWDGVEVEHLDTSHLGDFDAADTQPAPRPMLIGDLVDYGTVTATYQVNSDKHWGGVNAGAPIGKTATLAITFLADDDTVGGNWAASCGLQSLSPLSGEMETVMTGTATWKVLDKPTITEDTLPE
jgi:hypothetical protein